MNKRIIVILVLIAMLLSGCAGSSQKDPYTEGYEDGERHGYDVGFCDGEQHVEDNKDAYDWYEEDIVDMLCVIDFYAVMYEETKYLFNRLLEESGADDVYWQTEFLEIIDSWGNPVVYMQDGDEYYHREGCELLTESAFEITLEIARLERLDPCSACAPAYGVPVWPK